MFPYRREGGRGRENCGDEKIEEGNWRELSSQLLGAIVAVVGQEQEDGEGESR